jgi:hypothetical protein
MKKHQLVAEKKVIKAVGVFAKAVAEVEKAQDILKEGVKQDCFKVGALKKQIADIEAEIDAVNKGKIAKGEQMKANEELLSKLKEFKA